MPIRIAHDPGPPGAGEEKYLPIATCTRTVRYIRRHIHVYSSFMDTMQVMNTRAPEQLDHERVMHEYFVASSHKNTDHAVMKKIHGENGYILGTMAAERFV